MVAPEALMSDLPSQSPLTITRHLSEFIRRPTLLACGFLLYRRCQLLQLLHIFVNQYHIICKIKICQSCAVPSAQIKPQSLLQMDCLITQSITIANKKDGYRQQNVRQRQKLISIIDYDVCMTFY